MKSQNDRSTVYYIVLVGILMSITLVMKVIFHFIPIINGYGVEFYLVGYIFSMMLIRNRKWQWTYALLTPWVLLMIPPSFANFYDLLWEYILALYIFTPIIYFDKFYDFSIKKCSSKTAVVWQLIVFITYVVLAFALKLWIHTCAGVWWWTSGWIASLVFNAPIYGITLAITLPCTIVLYLSIIKFKYRENAITDDVVDGGDEIPVDNTDNVLSEREITLCELYSSGKFDNESTLFYLKFNTYLFYKQCIYTITTVSNIINYSKVSESVRKVSESVLSKYDGKNLYHMND